MQAVILLVAYTYTYGHTFVEDDPCPSVKLVWMPNSTQINSTSFPGNVAYPMVYVMTMTSSSTLTNS